MKVHKIFNEVRKFVNFREGYKEETYVKYESTLTLLRKTPKAALVKVVVASKALINHYYPWAPRPEELFSWDTGMTKEKEIWIPISCIEGDTDQDSFIISDWFCKKKDNDMLLYLTLYADRGHQRYYKVHTVENMEASIIRHNSEWKAKLKANK